MASDLVHSATNDKLTEMDWTKNIEICELVARDNRQAKDVIKAIKKRLGSKKSNTQLYAVMLLEMLINNIGEPVHKQVIDSGILPLLVKIVKKKSDEQVREKIFLLLDAAQTSVGGANGRFPQYYTSYYELVSAGVQFPQRPRDTPKPNPTSSANANHESKKESTTLERERSLQQEQSQARSEAPPESSILQKAGTALEVLRDVLDTIDTQRPEGAKDEFTLDLVEQCSFQKQRVMHLAVTSRDEKVVSRAIELNEHLERVLRRHDTLLSHRSMSTSDHFNHIQEEEEKEEEEAEQLFRRIRKGKACLRPQDEEDHEIMNRSMGLMGCALPGNIINRPLIRPVKPEPDYFQPKRETRRPVEPEPDYFQPKQETLRPSSLESTEANTVKPATIIPPPPAKHFEREKFFQGKTDGSVLNGHMRNLSLHSVNANSSQSGSTDLSD